MKCKTIERWIVQEEPPRSGHGDNTRLNRRQQRIEKHLKQCAACRQWREDYRRIGALAETGIPSGAPSPTVLLNIRREARLRVAEPPVTPTDTVFSFVAHLLAGSHLRPLYGLATVAALCLVLMGGWWLKPAPNGFGREAQLNTILLMMSEDAWGSADDTEAVRSTGIEETATLDALAQQILSLQGLDDGYTDTELSTPTAVPQATDPLTRSSGAFHAERYG